MSDLYGAPNEAESIATIHAALAKVLENGQMVRKRAKGTIGASHPHGKCFSH